jgi:hypothetical protein
MKLREEQIHTAVLVIRFLSVIPSLLFETLEINILKTITLPILCSCSTGTGNHVSSAYKEFVEGTV